MVLFVLDARDALESLRYGTGWEIEYPRDVWRLHKLPGIAIPAGPPCPRVRPRFEHSTQPWLRDLADVDRPLLARSLAHLASLPGGPGIKKTWIGALNLFFQNIRQHKVGWHVTRDRSLLPRRHPGGPRTGRPPSGRVRHDPDRGC